MIEMNSSYKLDLDLSGIIENITESDRSEEKVQVLKSFKIFFFWQTPECRQNTFCHTGRENCHKIFGHPEKSIQSVQPIGLEIVA
jgi:hypothetical protein